MIAARDERQRRDLGRVIKGGAMVLLRIATPRWSKARRCGGIGRDSTVIGKASPQRTVLRVSVARSVNSVRKLCTGAPSSVLWVRALAWAAGETSAAATGEGRAAAEAFRW